MGLSKVYRGYVIEDVNGQWYIRNAPTFTNGYPFNPGPHGGWTVATHQVDKLIEYTSRGAEQNRGRYQAQESQEPQHTYRSNSDSDIGFFEKRRIVKGIEKRYLEMTDEEFFDFYDRTKQSVARDFPEIRPWEELSIFEKLIGLVGFGVGVWVIIMFVNAILQLK